MNLTNWESIKTLNVGWQDEQHKSLFQQLAALHTIFIAGTDSVAVHETLDFLRNYSIDHFGLEELAMEHGGYEGMIEHVKEHEKFKRSLEDIYQSIDGGKQVSATASLIYNLNEWFVQHIDQTDRELSDYLISRSQVDLPKQI